MQRDRFRACLLAGAVGDALGGAVEFLSLAAIRATYGPAGIRDYAPAIGGQITDDTQMTLYTAAALLDAADADATAFARGDALVGRSLTAAYLHWLESQGQQARCALPGGHAAALRKVAALNVERAPGLTCLSSLAALTNLTAVYADNDRKGCGGVMRVAPIGLVAVGLPNAARCAFEWGCGSAAITHGHPTGYLASGATAAIIARLAEGHSLLAAIDTAQQLLTSHRRSDETSTALTRAVAAAARGVADAATVESLGGGWVAEETLAIAVYCALVTDDLEAGVALAANHSGDSDSTAAVAGQFLGLMKGMGAIPARWLDGLECRDLLTQMADSLWAQVANRPGLGI
jgi:hypothetical protein